MTTSSANDKGEKVGHSHFPYNFGFWIYMDDLAARGRLSKVPQLFGVRYKLDRVIYRTSSRPQRQMRHVLFTAKAAPRFREIHDWVKLGTQPKD